MSDIEKAKRLGHLFYIMRRERMPAHGRFDQEFRIRDMMVLDVIKEAIDRQKDGLVKMSDISMYFRITPAAASQMVREYERKGWLERVILDSDRRSVYCRVSEQAMTLLKQNEECLMAGMVDFIHYLGEEDSDALIRILEKAKNYGPIFHHCAKRKE